MKKTLLFLFFISYGVNNCYSDVIYLECVSISQTKHYIYYVVDTQKNILSEGTSQYQLTISPSEFYWKSQQSEEENRINRFSGVYTRKHSGPGIPVPYQCEVGKKQKF